MTLPLAPLRDKDARRVIPTSSLQIMEGDPADFDPAAGNREVDIDTVADLLPSIEATGQLVPGIAGPDPDRPGRWIVYDGNRRRFCCDILGFKFRFVEIAGAVKESDVIRLRVTGNHFRKGMSAFDMAMDIHRYMQLEGVNQCQAADAFGFSRPHTSRLLAPSKRMAPDLIEEAVKKGADVARIISRLPAYEQQREALRIVLEKDMKRDAVDLMVRRMLKTKVERTKREPKHQIEAGVLKGTFTGSPEDLLAAGRMIARAAKKAIKQNLGPESLPALLSH